MRKKFLVLSMITMVATGVFSGCNTKAVEPVKVEAAEKSVEVGSFKSDSLDFYRELSEEIGAIEIIDSADLSLEDLENRKGKIIIEKCIGVVENSDDSLEEIKKLEHHAEYLLDLENYPEIKSVSDVKVVEVE